MYNFDFKFAFFMFFVLGGLVTAGCIALAPHLYNLIMFIPQSFLVTGIIILLFLFVLTILYIAFDS